MEFLPLSLSNCAAYFSVGEASDIAGMANSIFLITASLAGWGMLGGYDPAKEKQLQRFLKRLSSGALVSSVVT